MERHLIILLFLIWSILQGCATPVQTRYNLKIPKDENLQNVSSEGNETKIVIDQVPPEYAPLPPHLSEKKVTYDTVKIDLIQNERIPNEISRGEELFLNGDYKNALQTFLSFVNRSNQQDYYYWYARFRIGECLYELKHIEQSIYDLTELYNNENIDRNIQEKIFLKLGKIYCDQKDFQKAKFYFELLRNNFPDSSFIPFECK